MELLICTRCKTDKPETSEFFPLHNKKNNGLDSWCRECRNKYRSDIRRGNYRGMISDENLKNLLQSIKECVICGIEAPLVVDHDHVTNKVRGLLCNKCNMAIGLLQDDPMLLEFARMYLIANSVSCSEPEHPEYKIYIEEHSK